MTPDVVKIYQTLLQEITNLLHEPGSRLSEEALVERFGISRTPIRDVLKRLEGDGLLDIQPKSGTYVSKIDLNDITAVVFIRSAVELEAMNSLCGCLDEKTISAAKDALQEQEKLLKDASSMKKEEFANAFLKADNDFHLSLYRAAGKETVLEVLNQSHPRYQRFRYLTGYRDIEESRKLYQIHLRILLDLEKGDHASLKEDVYSHNYAGLSGIQSVKDSHPDWF